MSTLALDVRVNGVDGTKAAMQSAAANVRGLASASDAATDRIAKGNLTAEESAKKLQTKTSQAGAAFSGLASALGASDGPIGAVAKSVTAMGAGLNFLSGPIGLAVAGVAALAAGSVALVSHLREVDAQIRLLGAGATGAQIGAMADQLKIAKGEAAALSGALARLPESVLPPTSEQLALVAARARAIGKDGAEGVKAYIEALKQGGDAAVAFAATWGGSLAATTAQEAVRLGLSREVVETLHAEDTARASVTGSMREGARLALAISTQEAAVGEALLKTVGGTMLARREATALVNVYRDHLAQLKLVKAAVDEETQARAASAEAMRQISLQASQQARVASEASADEARRLAMIGALEAEGQVRGAGTSALRAHITASRAREAIAAERVERIDGQIAAKTSEINKLLEEMNKQISRTPEETDKLAAAFSAAKVALQGLFAEQEKSKEQIAAEKKGRQDARKGAGEAWRAERNAQIDRVSASRVAARAIEELEGATTATRRANAEADVRWWQQAEIDKAAGTRHGAAERRRIDIEAAAKLAALRDAAKADDLAVATARSNDLAALQSRDLAIQTAFLGRRAQVLRDEGREEEAATLENRKAQIELDAALGAAELKLAQDIAAAGLLKDPERRADAEDLARKTRDVAIAEALDRRQIASSETTARAVEARVKRTTAALALAAPAAQMAGGKFAAAFSAASKGAAALAKHNDNLAAGAGDLISAGGEVAAAFVSDEKTKAAILAITETAAGFATLANAPVSAGHFAAAAIYGGVAGGVIGGSSSSGGTSTGGGATTAQSGQGQQSGPTNTTINFNGFVIGTQQQAGQMVNKAAKSLKKTGLDKMKAA